MTLLDEDDFPQEAEGVSKLGKEKTVTCDGLNTEMCKAVRKRSFRVNLGKKA